MKYTTFGNSNVEVSSLGFGCMRMPQTNVNGENILDEDAAVQLLRKAYDLGVTYFDSAYFYHAGRSEHVLGRALKGIRDKVVVSTKSPSSHMKQAGDYRRVLEEQLTKLDMDYIDFYHFHGISYEGFVDVDKRTGWIADAIKAKEEGLVKHLSFSFHASPGDDVAEEDKASYTSDNMIKLIDLGYFESVLCQYNVLDRSNERGMAYAKSKGMGVAVMGPLGGGRVSGLPKELAAKLGIEVRSSVELGLRFVAANPNVDIILSGMSSEAQLVENAALVSDLSPLSGSERDGIDAMMQENRRLAQLYCTGCGYCVPCPQEVNIPHIFSMMNYHNVYGITEFAKNGYKSIGTGWITGKRADACNKCGACEKKCPQKIHIREQLADAHAALA